MTTQFPAYINIDDALDDNIMKPLEKLLELDNKSEESFIESHVYNRISKENVTNKHLRASKKIEYRDNNIFDYIETNIVGILNNIGDDYQFSLIRNDVEIVKYEVGDFFKPHQDYINFDSNEFKNYTLIINMKPCIKGGATVLHFDDEQTIIKESGQKYGNILLFQKSIVHEGEMIEEGSKWLLKCNLICMPKSKEYEDIIVVRFPKQNNKMYILRTEAFSEEIKETVYYTSYLFNKKNHPNKHVYYYDETVADMALFETEIYQKLNGLDVNNVRERRDMRAYMGIQVNKNNILEKFVDFCSSEMNTIEEYKVKEVFLCNINDYYNLIHWEYPKNVIPIQMVSLENERGSWILWLGTYDNRLITFDYYIKSYEIKDNDDIGKKISKRIKKKLDKNWIENMLSGGLYSLMDNVDEIIDKISRKIIYDEWKFKSLDKLFSTTSTNQQDILCEYIKKHIDNIKKNDCGYEAEGGYYIASNKKYNHIPRMKDKLNYHDLNVNYDIFDRINIEDIIYKMKKTESISDKTSASIVEYNDGDCDGITFDIIFRMGFLKIE